MKYANLIIQKTKSAYEKYPTHEMYKVGLESEFMTRRFTEGMQSIPEIFYQLKINSPCASVSSPCSSVSPFFPV